MGGEAALLLLGGMVIILAVTVISLTITVYRLERQMMDFINETKPKENAKA